MSKKTTAKSKSTPKTTKRKTSPKTKSMASKKAVAQTVKKAKVSKAVKPVSNEIMSRKNPVPKAKVAKKQLFIAAVIILVGLGLYFLKGVLFIATVNGQPLSRLTLVKRLESQYGKVALQDMITETLIMQEAMKANIKIEDNVVDEELKKIEEQLTATGQTLESFLQAQGMTHQELKDRIKLQKMLEEIIIKQIVVSEEEVDEYLETNKEYLPEDQTEEELRTLAQNQLIQQKTMEKFSEWLQEKVKDAKINYFTNWAAELKEETTALE